MPPIPLASPAASEANSKAKTAKAKTGRPRIGTESQTLAHQQPWLAENMSERTWYRRQKEKRELAAGEGRWP
jgi:hypothetical protein